MAEKKVDIKIQGEGITFEDNIPRELVPQIINLCISSHNAEKAASSDSPFALFDTPKKTARESVVEYLQRRNARSNSEKILAFAGYIKDVQDRDIFYSNEIKSLFRDAREILPANFTRDFNLVIGNGWIHKDTENPDAYYITQTGLKALETGFAEGVPKRAPQKSKNGKTNTK